MNNSIEDDDSGPGQDDDIASLFRAAASQERPPRDLDDAIRAAARASSAGAAGAERLDAIGRLPDILPLPRRIARDARRWLPIAAVVVLGVLLVPLLEHESAPPDPLAKSSPGAADVSAEADARAITDSGTAVPEAEPRIAGNPGAGIATPIQSPALTAARRAPMEFAREAEATTELQETAMADWRGSAEQWIAHLRETLEDNGVSPALRADYLAFRHRYPDFEPGFVVGPPPPRQ